MNLPDAIDRLHAAQKNNAHPKIIEHLQGLAKQEAKKSARQFREVSYICNVLDEEAVKQWAKKLKN